MGAHLIQIFEQKICIFEGRRMGGQWHAVVQFWFRCFVSFFPNEAPVSSRWIRWKGESHRVQNQPIIKLFWKLARFFPFLNCFHTLQTFIFSVNFFLTFLYRCEQEDIELKHSSTLKQLMREFNTQLAQKEMELETAVKETISKWYTNVTVNRKGWKVTMCFGEDILLGTLIRICM